MSVKFHESYCLDSQQDQLIWWDDFLGDQIQDEWDSTIAGAGTTVVVDQQTGGIVRLTTGALTGNNNVLDWNDIRSLLVTKRISMECRVKVNQLTQAYVTLGLVFDGSNQIRFYAANAAGADDWEIWCEDGGATTRQESGITLDTSYHIFRIECHIHGGNHVHFYIDGTQTANSPITTNIPDDATDYLQPHFLIQTRVDVAKSMDIDYVVVRQEI